MLVSFVILGIWMFGSGTVCTEVGFAAADIGTLKTNLVRYRMMAGDLPSVTQGLSALVTMPSGEPVPQRWHPFMDSRALIDPWSHPYQYQNPGKVNTGGADVYSLCPDGTDGTADDVYAQ